MTLPRVPDGLLERALLEVPCPSCKAAVGEWCPRIHKRRMYALSERLGGSTVAWELDYSRFTLDEVLSALAASASDGP